MIGLMAMALAVAGPLEKCELPSGWEEVDKRRTAYVVFGEVHGTAEAPALVGDVACGLAFRGDRLLVAIEQQASDDAALQAAWALPDERFAAALVRTGWAGRKDGVASRAMFELLVRLHRLRTGGRPIDVVAFNGARDPAQAARFAALPGQGPHEAEQAENIRLADSGRHDDVLVLTGNLHARKQPVTRGGVTFEPMAMRLAAAGAVTTLNMADAGGTMWNCLMKPGVEVPAGQGIPKDAIECGAHPTRGSADLSRPAYIGLGAAPGENRDPAFDGFLWVGRTTASPPAVTTPPGR
ncbi:hypothetical protein [Sphingomonas bacterium]|uniref:hypothetical protein n=1 Tax=Sphingomonas bacterium TaxID=1895847 RepID=UPI00157699EE|nr:hypothetical protein [Sphingomonas bacterium]